MVLLLLNKATRKDSRGSGGSLASFDAWGNRRNPETWQPYTTTPPSLLFDRGFTGHEHALDERENGNYWGLQPGEAGGQPITTTADLNLDYVTNAAISDGRIKNPTLLNKLGFGKRGYYSVYLVSADGVDYHWYRQDKGGMWSHKPGITPVVNVDASGRFISNPVRANHGIYNNGGILLWVKRR